MTQIVTAIVAVEEGGNLDELAVTIDEDTVAYFDGRNLPIAGLAAGEVYSLRQLISLMLVTNACDAALAVAKHISDGDVRAFVSLMNTRTKSMGLIYTKFDNPTGEHSENQYTTAHEMSIIGRYCMNGPGGITEMANQPSVELPRVGDRSARVIRNSNPMLIKDVSNPYYYSKVRAISSSHDSRNGDSALTFASERGIRYLIVILGAPIESPVLMPEDATDTDYQDDDKADEETDEDEKFGTLPTEDFGDSYRGAMLLTKQLYEWVYRTTDITIAPENGRPVANVPVSPHLNKTTLNLLLQRPIAQYLTRSTMPSEVRLLLFLPEDIDREIKKNEILGTALIMRDSTVLNTANLISENAVKEQGVKNPFIEGIKILLIILVVLILLLFIVRYINLYRYRKRRRRRRRMKISK
jgi:D-alanyl-D-alanine carboxypeptidase (penicillin-binding protein 5/6)